MFSYISDFWKIILRKVAKNKTKYNIFHVNIKLVFFFLRLFTHASAWRLRRIQDADSNPHYRFIMIKNKSGTEFDSNLNAGIPTCCSLFWIWTNTTLEAIIHKDYKPRNLPPLTRNGSPPEKLIFFMPASLRSARPFFAS